MKLCTVVSISVLTLCFAGCMNPQPADVQSSLSASPELYATNPTNIAVLPVEDASPDRRANPHLAHIRDELARALVRQSYSPFSARAVDGPLANEAIALNKDGGVTNASLLQRLAGKFGEDAVLGVKIDSWDESSLMADNKVRFSSDVALLDSKGKRMLWSGHVNGEVKAGGFGPAPLDRDEKSRSAAAEFAWALIQRLPSRGK